MILAGDIGGTKTRLGLFEPQRIVRGPWPFGSLPTLDYPDLSAIISAFANDRTSAVRGFDTAAFGVAGPVMGDRAAADERSLAVSMPRTSRTRSTFGASAS